MRRALTTVCIALCIVLAGCSGGGDLGSTGSYQGGADAGDGANVGVAAGGAQDANAFRANVEAGYVPRPDTLTYEGLYHDYFFDTGQQRECEETFCPSYSRAVTRDPVSNETERYLSVGLNSGVSKADFAREKLDLVVVLDTSGSMSSPFDEYYYDGGERKQVERNGPKMDAAANAVGAMTRKLGDDDRIGVVAYDSDARTLQSLERVGDLEMDELRADLRAEQADGGTNLDAAMTRANEMAAAAPDGENRSTRVVYVTDAMPNLGDTSGRSLEGRLAERADEGIFTTFVGVGVDFNAELAESISTVRGANYYSVQSPSQFEERMDEGFAYMVTPLVHDLTLDVDAEGYDVEHVYGSPQADESTDELLHVETLFPSRSTANGSEGSVMLVELERIADGAADREVTLTASYEDTDGQTHESTRSVTFPDQEAPYYDDSGVRKAVVLTEYATLLRNWMVHERAGADAMAVEADESVERRELGTWEQRSVPLAVTSPYDERIDRFAAYFERHAEALGVDEFERDRAVLDTLRSADDRAVAEDDRTVTDDERAVTDEM